MSAVSAIPPPYLPSFLCALLFSRCFLIHLASPSWTEDESGVSGGEVLEQKSFTAGLRSIYEHQDFAVRLLRSRLRNLFAGPANKGRKSKNINAKAFFFFFSSRWSHGAPLLTNSYFSSATLRLFSFQKRRNIRIIESNIHRPFAALRFFSICAERLFKKNELYSFHFPSAVFSFCLFLSHVFHGAVAVCHD